jgi:phospholipase C
MPPGMAGLGDSRLTRLLSRCLSFVHEASGFRLNAAGTPGYVKPVSFFGDGPRVPLFVISPYARPGFVDHTYNDHVSILKFIEANWNLSPLTSFSEDNLPNATPGVYVPKDRPAIGNLLTLFDFQHPNFGALPLRVRPLRSAPAGRIQITYRVR